MVEETITSTPAFRRARRETEHFLGHLPRFGKELVDLVGGVIRDDSGKEGTQVEGILARGGTILGTANRGNPFARKVVRSGVEEVVDVSQQIIENISLLEIDGLAVLPQAQERFTLTNTGWWWISPLLFAEGKLVKETLSI